MDYSLDYQLAADQTGLLPIINNRVQQSVSRQVNLTRVGQGVGFLEPGQNVCTYMSIELRWSSVLAVSKAGFIGRFLID